MKKETGYERHVTQVVGGGWSWALPASQGGERGWCNTKRDAVATVEAAATGLHKKIGAARFQRWASPMASDHMRSLSGRQNSCRPREAIQLSLHPVVSQTSGARLSPTRRTSLPRLNPVFVEWLMGWPTWWTNTAPTACAPLAMESYHSRLQSRFTHYASKLA